MVKNLLILACIFGILAVILGAFGAHALKAKLSADQLTTYETGIRYQFYHTFAILISAILLYMFKQPAYGYAGYLFVVGILFFSGSIYLLAIREIIGLSNYKWLGPITPVGGMLFIFGWLSILWGVLKSNFS